MKKIVVVIFLLSVSSMAQSIQLNFLDEYILKDSLSFKNTIVGGLSGIDKEGDSYYLIVDDSNLPRVLKAEINLEQDEIKSVSFLEVINVKGESKFFKTNFFDLESVFVNNNEIHIVSEGSVNKKKDPAIFSINDNSELIENYKIPKYFKTSYSGGPRHNAVFEASTKSVSNKGFWVATEGVIKADGEDPGLHSRFSPSRVTYYSYNKKKPLQQFAYPLDKLNRPVIGRFNVNGITALLEYKENCFFVVERAYQSGYGINGNSVKIYNIVLNDETNNTLKIKSLKNKKELVVKKELLFNFDVIRDRLTNNIIDNIEGISLGPKLSNGNRSLLLISDDNFQKFGNQLNQFILLEILE